MIHAYDRVLTSKLSLFFFNDPATTEIYTLSLHDALPIYWRTYLAVTLRVWTRSWMPKSEPTKPTARKLRSEEHTSELQSQSNLVCRLLLEKKKTEAVESVPPELL